MDQHTFLELVVLGAAIALSGYIGYVIGWEKGRTAFSAWWVETQQAEGKPESTVYFGEDTPAMSPLQSYRHSLHLAQAALTTKQYLHKDPPQ